jgi:hypothetical protein
MAQTRASLGDLPIAFANLVNAQVRLGADLFESLTGQPMLGQVEAFGRRLVGGAGACDSRAGCCHVPPPCWMPQALGECTSHVTPCRTACIRLVVTNCDRIKRTITVRAGGKDAGSVAFSPAFLYLGPAERGTVSACVSVPDNAQAGERLETLVWVRGCREHYLRWTVSVGTLGVDSCHEVEVCDCPDYRHHWYDHFHAFRPCLEERTPGGGPNEPRAVRA